MKNDRLYANIATKRRKISEKNMKRIIYSIIAVFSILLPMAVGAISVPRPATPDETKTVTAPE